MVSLLGVGGALSQRRDIDIDQALRERQVATGEMTAQTNRDILGLDVEQHKASIQAEIRKRQEESFETLLSTMATLQKEKGEGNPNIQNTIDQFSPILAQQASELGMSEIELTARIAGAKGEITDEVAQSGLGKLIADREATAKRLGEDHPLVVAMDEKIQKEAYGEEGKKVTPFSPAERVEFGIPEGVIAAWQDDKMVINDVRTESTYTLSPVIDENGNVSFQAEVTGGGMGGGSGVGTGVPKGISPEKIDAMRARILAMESSRNVVSKLLQQPDETFGGTASARKFTENVTALSSELLTASGIPRGLAIPEFVSRLFATDPRGVDSEAAELLRPLTSGDIDVTETILTFQVARALQDDDDKLLASSVKEAKALVSLRGLKSGELIKDRLVRVDGLLANAIGNYRIRLDQGVTGTSDRSATPIIPDAPVDPIEAALQAAEKAAGIR